jgi:hypothetical protein
MSTRFNGDEAEDPGKNPTGSRQVPLKIFKVRAYYAVLDTSYSE